LVLEFSPSFVFFSTPKFPSGFPFTNKIITSTFAKIVENPATTIEAALPLIKYSFNLTMGPLYA